MSIATSRPSRSYGAQFPDLGFEAALRGIRLGGFVPFITHLALLLAGSPCTSEFASAQGAHFSLMLKVLV
jgi:hypothetical protein